MSKQREALQLALEALTEVTGWQWAGPMRVMDEVEDAIAAIRKALAEPEQEPATWQYRWLNQNKMDCEPFEMDWKAVATGPGLTLDAAISDLEAYKDRSGKSVYEVRPLYTAPPARKPLTDEDISTIVQSMSAYTWDAHMLARAIERAHGIGD